jgi:hypothetical protein
MPRSSRFAPDASHYQGNVPLGSRRRATSQLLATTANLRFAWPFVRRTAQLDADGPAGGSALSGSWAADR